MFDDSVSTAHFLSIVYIGDVCVGGHACVDAHVHTRMWGPGVNLVPVLSSKSGSLTAPEP